MDIKIRNIYKEDYYNVECMTKRHFRRNIFMIKVLFICRGSAHKLVVFSCKVAHFGAF